MKLRDKITQAEEFAVLARGKKGAVRGFPHVRGRGNIPVPFPFSEEAAIRQVAMSRSAASSAWFETPCLLSGREAALLTQQFQPVYEVQSE